jgi:septum formation inhibitor MinC
VECDADADGNVYVYSILTGDLLEGAGGELIGLYLS